MQLPEHLQHFPHIALLVASDSVLAKFFLLGGETLEEVDSLTVPRVKPQDNEGSIRIEGGGGVSGANSDIDDTPRLKEFIHKMVERINEIVAESGVVHIHLVMPAEIEHQLTAHLPNTLKERVVKRVHHDLVKNPPLEIVERLFKD